DERDEDRATMLNGCCKQAGKNSRWNASRLHPCQQSGDKATDEAKHDAADERKEKTGAEGGRKCGDESKHEIHDAERDETEDGSPDRSPKQSGLATWSWWVHFLPPF